MEWLGPILALILFGMVSGASGGWVIGLAINKGLREMDRQLSELKAMSNNLNREVE